MNGSLIEETVIILGWLIQPIIMHYTTLLKIKVCLLAQIILHACCTLSIAQQKIVVPRNTVFFAPLNVFDMVNPSIQAGYERMISPKIAVQVEGGYILHHSIPNVIIDVVTGVNVKDCEYTHKG
ncbi:MAG: hypothetical protein KF746_27765 [Chitinophagaceae bacterium]|nr:hypothetical protein [Chitinophagaceae bacterium]